MINKIIFSALIFLTIITIFSLPAMLLPDQVYGAEGEGFFANLCTNEKNPDGSSKGAPSCNFNDLVNLGWKIINFLLIISIPVAAICFAIAGFMFLTAAGNSGKIDKARGIFMNVAVGFVIILIAWLVIKVITTALFSTTGDSPVQLLTANYNRGERYSLVDSRYSSAVSGGIVGIAEEARHC